MSITTALVERKNSGPINKVMQTLIAFQTEICRGGAAPGKSSVARKTYPPCVISNMTQSAYSTSTNTLHQQINHQCFTDSQFYNIS